MLIEQQANCPYCGEQITLFVDHTQGDHRTIEDCFVCCRPIEILIECQGGELSRLVVGSNDEQLY